LDEYFKNLPRFHTSGFNHYRIGDIVKTHPNVFKDVCGRWPDTLMCKYTKLTNSSCDLSTLYRLAAPQRKFMNDVLFVHLRLGDSLLESPRNSGGCWSDDQYCYMYRTCRYAFGESYYTSLFKEKVELSNFKKVVIVSNSFHSTTTKWTPDRLSEDKLYLKQFTEFVKKLSPRIEVQYKYLSTPDEDLVFLLRSRHYVVSGGGYSQLVAKLIIDAHVYAADLKPECSRKICDF